MSNARRPGALGRLIQAKRHELVISQEALAKAAATDRSTISRLESGEAHSVAFDTGLRILDALALSDVEWAQLKGLGGHRAVNMPRRGDGRKVPRAPYVPVLTVTGGGEPLRKRSH